MSSKFPHKNILIACSVNTARSRMAEGYLRKFCIDKNFDIEINSGGIGSNARDGMLISIDAIDAMREEGIELSKTALSIDLKKKEHRHFIEKADLILTLTEQQKNDIKNYVKENKTEIYTLKEFAGECGDIEDPSMKELEGFRKARDEIKKCLMKGLQKYFY